jgi:4-hydroxybenzoate polyprenyltransferase
MRKHKAESAPMERMRLRIAAIGGFVAFARPGNWFVSKIPPLLAVAYLEILRSGIAPHNAARLLACCLFSIFCVAIYGHVLNDIFDQETDRLANKVNRLATMRPVWRGLLPPAFLIGGFLPTLAAHYSIGSLLLLTLNYLWPTVYSIPFARLKERGLFGVACDALGSHITPTLFVLELFATSGPAGSSSDQTAFALMVTLWAAALGLKGILHHQIADRENDIQSGIVTFATNTRPEVLQRFLTGFNLLAELPVSALLTALVSSWCPLAITAFIIYTGSEVTKYLLGFKFALTANPATIRASVPFTNEMFYILWMPMAAATQISLDNPALISLPILHAVIFHQPVVQQLSDWLAIIKNATLVYRGRCSMQGR